MRLRALASICAFALASSSAPLLRACSSHDLEATGETTERIVKGTPAVQYPEAVYVTSDGYVPCSGVLLAPTVVLSAGHCRGRKSTFEVVAPHADGQSAHGSASWSPYDGSPSKSPDVMLIFLDAPIVIPHYPTLGATEVQPGTQVVDVGRTRDGVIETGDYVSPPVTIRGPATALGFPYNYEAVPDVSETGDSGGPIMLAGTHTIVGIVDTDTLEQNVASATPIDLFARIDLVHDAIVAAIAGGPPDSGAEDAGSYASSVSGGCSVAARPVPESLPPLGPLLAAAALFVRVSARVSRPRRSRRRLPSS